MKIEGNTLVQVEEKDLINGHFTCPEGIKAIGMQAFLNLTSLISITLPKSLVSIEQDAFKNCSNFIGISLGPNLTYLGDAFVGCTSLTNFYASPGIKTLFAFGTGNSIKNFFIDTCDDEEIRKIRDLVPLIYKPKLVKKSSFFAWFFNVQRGLEGLGLNKDIYTLITLIALKEKHHFFWNWTIHEAAELGKVGVITQHAKDHGNIEESNPYYEERITSCIAAKNGQTQIILELYGNWVDLDKTNHCFWAPIHYAAFHGKTEIIALLARLGVNLNRASQTTGTPIYYAALKGQVGAIIELANHPCVDINRGKLTGDTPLFIAAQSNHIEAVKTLLQLGADPSLCFKSNAFNLKRFARNKTEDIRSRMDEFIEKQQNSEELLAMSPLDIAWVMGNTKIIELLQNPAPVTAFGFFNTTTKNGLRTDAALGTASSAMTIPALNQTEPY